MKITIPLEISANHAYITTRTGKRIMTAEYRSYKEAMRLSIQSLVKRLPLVEKPLPYVSSIRLCFFWPDKRRRDYDNYEKIAMDCIKGIVIEDDSCWNIGEKMSVTAGIDKDNPRVEISFVV